MYMKEESKNKLPPIIVEYIEKLSDSKSNKWQKDMYCVMLERIQQACQDAINTHNAKTKLPKITSKK
jgi:hypothetical protein